MIKHKFLINTSRTLKKLEKRLKLSLQKRTELEEDIKAHKNTIEWYKKTKLKEKKIK